MRTIRSGPNPAATELKPFASLTFPNENSEFRQVRGTFFWIFLLAFVLRLALFFVGIAHMDERGHNPAFFWHDSNDYLQPALSLLHHGTYTIDEGGQQVPYFTRPPSYALFIAACFKIGGERIASILLPQLVLAALACSLAFWIAAMLVNRRVGVLTGLFMAMDQMLIAYSNKIMTETFSMFLLAASTVALLLFLARGKPVFLWMSGILLAIGALAHASSSYYWVVPVAVLAIWAGVSWREKLRWMLVFAVPFFAITGIWVVRNHHEFGVWQLSPKGKVVGVAASLVLWHEQPQRTREDVANTYYHHVDKVFSDRYGVMQAQWKDMDARMRDATANTITNTIIGQMGQFSWTDPVIRHRYFRYFLDTQNEEAVHVFRHHFRTYFKMMAISFVRMTVLPMPYAELCRFSNPVELNTSEQSWRPIVLNAAKSLLHGNLGKFKHALGKVPVGKMMNAGWNVLYWFLTIPAACVGLYLILRRWPLPFSILLVGTIAYFVVTTSITCAGDAMHRYRLRTLPYVYCVAAVGWLCRNGKPRSSAPAP